MKVYCVGGAVRDKLLNRKVGDKDWVVVGATPEALTALGYQPVGKSFPVFLHPKTKEEYALARTEKKVAKGYHGFTFNTDVSVTLEEDLARRDLTINAIASDNAGNLIDPYGGASDIKKRLLKHVSPAFSEDPVRILRLARFAARFHHLGFKVASETNALMKHMVKNKEVDALIPERVIKEWQTAMQEENPEIFFQVLNDCHALNVIFPMLKPYYENIITSLKKITPILSEPDLRLGALGYVLGNTPEEKSLAVNALLKHYTLPQHIQFLLKFTANFIMPDNTPEQLLVFLEKTDAFRRPVRLSDTLKILSALLHPNGTIINHLEEAFNKTKTITAQSLDLSKLKGPAISHALHKKRLQVLENFTT